MRVRGHAKSFNVSLFASGITVFFTSHLLINRPTRIALSATHNSAKADDIAKLVNIRWVKHRPTLRCGCNSEPS